MFKAQGNQGQTPRSSENGAGRDSLASILTFSERSDLVNLVESIASKIVENAETSFQQFTQASDEPANHQDEPITDLGLDLHRRATLRWYTKWKGLVLRRICEAANTRWEPLGQKKSNSAGKSWDELSWDDEPEETNPVHPTTIDTTLQMLYPPISTPLIEMDRDKRLLLLHSMLLLLLSLKHYYAPSRRLLLWLASSINLTTDDVDNDEKQTATSLVSGAKEMSAKEEVERKARETQSSRTWKVFGASVAGAALIGLTGGLAAPLVAAGIGTVMGGLGLGATAAAGLLGSLAGSSVLVGGLFGAYGARMTGQMMEQYAQEISDFAFIPLRSKTRGEDVKEVVPADRRLRVTIGVSGWLTETSDVVQPWRVLGNGTEVFALRWELEALSKLGSGLRELVSSAAWGYARTEILKLTVFSALIGAVVLPLGLIQLGRFVDNPFQVTKVRADKAGEVLADAIINRAQGERPVVLVGYSLGARLIYSCLQNLAKRQAFGLVDTVVLCGASVPNSADTWKRARSVVGDRLINVYSENDYVLGFLYRAISAQAGIAGLQKVCVRGVENKDVGNVVTSHFQYRHLLGQILHELGWRDLDETELAHEREALKRLLEEEKKMSEALNDERADRTEQKRLRNLMNTQAPVRRASSDTGSGTLRETPMATTKRRENTQDPRKSTDTEQEDVQRIRSSEQEADGKPLSPMQTLEPPEPESETENLEENFSGIQMVDHE